MTDQFESELHERLDRLSGAVPLDPGAAWRPETGTTTPIGRGVLRSLVGTSAAPLAAIAVLVVIGVALAGLARPGDPTGSDADGAGSVSASSTDGPFQVTIRADHGRYAQTDPIEIEASLVYTGPGGEIAIQHGHGSPIAFGIVEPVLGIEMSPSWRSSCEETTLRKGDALITPFGKSGGFDDSDPQAELKKQFLTDPVLRLPTGIWHVFAVAWFDIGGCGADEHQIRAELTIEVVAPAETSTSSAPAPAPSASPLVTPLVIPGSAFPDSCEALEVTLNRCAGYAAWAIEQAGLGPRDVELIEMTMSECPGGLACPTDATGFLVNVHLVTNLGDVSDEVVNCTRRPEALGGINFLCVSITTGDGRPIQYPLVVSPTSGGYRDIPCTGEAPAEAPADCATPLPAIEPSALASAAPLAIDALEIAIDHAGPYSVELGQASLPNGILSAAAAEITSSPINPLVAFNGYRITVESLEGGSPFSNYYVHGWRPGTERVRVTLNFVVLTFEPGAVVVVSGVDVH